MYISLDKAGVRRTSCVNPDVPSYNAIIELLSHREDTIVWPFFYNDANGEEITLDWKDGELEEFGNIAAGKGEAFIVLSLERNVDQDPKDPPFPTGLFRMDVYLNDESAPRDSLRWSIDTKCDLRPIPDTI